MNRCNLCVIPDTRPDTAFVDGVCSACLNFLKRPAVDWRAHRAELESILKVHGGRCIVPSSGGKDSTWQVLKLLEMGADVTVVTATTCMLTPIGRANIDNLKRFARTVELSPNEGVRAKLNRLGLTLVGDVSWPEHVAIHRAPFRAAVDLGIPLIFYGENPLAQYGSPPGLEEAREMTQRWVSEFGGFLGLRAADMVGEDFITARDMADYLAPTDDELRQAGVTAYFLGQFFPWDSHENARAAIDHGFACRLPCEANLWDFENQDNAMTGLHDHAMYRKFGYGRLAAQASVDVRNGRMTRERALELVAERDGLFPRSYMGVPFGRVCHRLGMTEPQVMETLDRFTSWDLFDGVERGRPMLREFAVA